MSRGNLWTTFKSVLRTPNDGPLDLDDATSFDFSGEVLDEELPKFNQLRVVVSDEMSDSSPGIPHAASAVNGRRIHSAVSEDDSILGSSSSLQNQGIQLDQCDGCTKKKEQFKQKKVKKKLAFAAILYFLFMIGELIAKPPTKRFTFGLHRLEVISAVVSVLLIYILAAVLLYEAVQRTIHQDFDIDGDVMLITAAVGVAVNLIMGFILNQTGHLHSHSHGTSQHATSSGQGGHGHSHGKSHGSLAVRAAFIHALGDLVQSVGVLVAAYIIRFKPEYKIADPICTYVFSVLVLFTTLRIMWDTGIIVLEGVPKHLDVTSIKEDLLKLEDVYSVDDLNVWALTAGKTAAVVHLQLIPDSSTKWEEVQSKARLLLLNTYGMYKCTIQVQSFRQRLPQLCVKCQCSSA
ncbi:zinc transporter 4-like isoform X2 [Polyodon spathula]|uniref:zinc transporter 4-like isoform X2 n=1 Tax=Polyodon spathula TaxID=7913 RepID=UPI001B7E9355|nr:zinc transporter 4-like isoform X2 [Polyodon spathula]